MAEHQGECGPLTERDVEKVRQRLRPYMSDADAEKVAADLAEHGLIRCDIEQVGFLWWWEGNPSHVHFVREHRSGRAVACLPVYIKRGAS